MLHKANAGGRCSRDRWFRSVGVLLAVALLAPAAWAQLVPDREFYGIDRKMPMTVRAPEDFGGEVTIRLLEPESAEPAATAAAAVGPVDLAGLFPSLWQTEEPKLVYAQLFLNEEAVGPAVVVSPMLTPDYAHLVDVESLQPTFQGPPRGRPMFESERLRILGERGLAPPGGRQVVFSGYRAWTDRHVVLETSLGEIEFRMRPDAAPNTVLNFLRLAEGGFYTDVIFHRIVAQLPNGAPFVVQVGDPTGSGSGGPGYFIDLEPSTLPHAFGVLSMARSTNPNSNGSQVFVCLSREGTSFLDHDYTAFAEAVSGADVIQSIASVETQGGARDNPDRDRPVDPPLVRRARVVDAPPYGIGPQPVQEPERPAPER